MTRFRRVGAFAAVALASALLLTGCVAPAPTPTRTPEAAPVTPAPSPTPTPTPEPVDPLLSTARLMISADRLSLVDEAGTTVAEFGYLEEPALAIEALTKVFGSPPRSEPYAGTNHAPSGVRHTWGDAVEIDERHYDESRRAEYDYRLVWPRFAVYFDEAQFEGLGLTTPTGVTAGIPWPEYEVTGNPNPGWSCDGPIVDIESLESEDGSPRDFGVVLGGWWSIDAPGSEVVPWIGAPYAQAEGCA